MKTFLTKNHRLLFYSVWLLLTLMQSSLTELQDDEAYYWVFSKYLAWGYFDHPPMTAILIRGGTFLFGGELGVRLLFVFLNMLTLHFIEKLTEKKDPFIFYSIALSIAALQLAGFFAVPDTPLIFFTALFFWRYKQFNILDSLQNTLLLAVTAALLFYTKYHAVLIVFFTLISHLRLFRKPRVYLAGFIALLLFTPHLYWQWQHHWVSVRYHLFESNVDPYKFSYTTNYLLGQLLLAGPIAGLILLPAALLHKSSTYTEKAMKYTMIGTYIFFLISSFRGKVEPNWTSAALVPLIILSHQYIREKSSWLKWLMRTLPLSILLVLLGRIVMADDVLPVKAIQKKFHAWTSWPEEMRRRTNGLPVVFSNSYQRASKYWFYSGQVTYSQNNVRDHRNNYNYWPIEESLLGKPVYFMDIYDLYRFKDSLQTRIGTIGYRYDSASSSMAMIQFLPKQNAYHVMAGEPVALSGKIELPEKYGFYISAHPGLEASIRIIVLIKKAIITDQVISLKLADLLKGKFSILFDPRVPRGDYDMIFSIESPGLNPTHNSERISLTVDRRSF
jgi:hypothetical protein